jgi:ribonuclease G
LPGDLLIAAVPGDWRAALLENGVPVELYVERGDRSEAGSVHLGRVWRLVPTLNAALVDIGGDRPAFLPASEVLPRGRRLAEGERVIVQVRREAQGGKAPQLTTGVVLRGRHLELRIGRAGIVGGEMLSSEERAQLLALLAGPVVASGLAPHPRIKSGAGSPASRVPPSPRERGEGWGQEQPGMGLRIIEPAPFEALLAEGQNLAQRWCDIFERAAQREPPARLDPPLSLAGALASVMRAPPDSILTDDPAVIPELRRMFSAISVQHGPEAEWPIDLDEIFDQALSGTVALTGGGAIHIEGTRAAVLIDVDSGTPDAGSPEGNRLAVNLAAADAIARHIRLRNLGGGIVVDFAGLEDRSMRSRVRDRFIEALAPDPARPQILGWTRLGHFELVRPRRGRPLAEALLEPRPGGCLVKTVTAAAYDALCALRREARAQPGRRWRLTVAPDVASTFSGAAGDALRALEERFGREIMVVADSTLGRERFQIAPV